MYHFLYIEPGSGVYIIQMIIAAVLGAFFWVRIFWQRFRKKQSIVFYAESRHYYQYFERLINDLLAKNARILYVTSDKKDPLLKAAPAGMQVLHVKWMLGFFFSKIKADVMVLTMPDLGDQLFKRSASVKKYVYVFHAAVSTQQQYRKEAFINYDTIFCTGDYHQKEIRKAEEVYGTKQKEIIPYGYPLLDAIKEQTHPDARQIILVAPSWFEGCIFDTCIEELLLQLSKLPYEVVLRCHPEYKKRKKQSFERITAMMKEYPNMMMDEEPDVIKTLAVTDILITDRSGIAFEFALGAGKPVLFVDTALKQSNPDVNELGLEPVENSLRPQLGIAVSPTHLDQLSQKINELSAFANGFKEKMKVLEKDLLYNSEEAYQKGADYIIEQVQR